MPHLDLDRLLASVGKEVFVQYFEQFQDFSVPNDGIAALLPQEYTLNSRRSRTSTARRIIREGLSRDALEMIVFSDRLDPESLLKARLLLEHLRPALTMSTCQCGCGGNPASGNFVQGHDQRLRVKLEHRVGGLIVLRDLVDAAEAYVNGGLSLQPFSDQIRRIFAEARSSQSES